jgi:hypothetical protein
MLAALVAPPGGSLAATRAGEREARGAALRRARAHRAELRARARLRAEMRTQVRAQVRAIDRFCDRLAETTADMQGRRLFGLAAASGEGAAKWIEFHDARRLEWSMRHGQAAEVAEVWTRVDRATAMTVTLRGDGGWGEYLEYCFRGDGSLARVLAPRNAGLVESSAADTTGDGRLERRYFAAGGERLALPPPAPVGRTARLPRRSRGRAADAVYRSLAELPFALLLADEAGPHP